MIEEILQHKIISIVGSGGKTTLMYALAEELSRLGKKVIMTTSTKIFLPETCPVVFLPGKSEMTENSRTEAIKTLRQTLASEAICVTGIWWPSVKDEQAKLSSYLDSGITATEFLEFADYVLIEADGSKHMPLKFPNEDEPVIPDDSDMVIAVVGLWCIGHPLKEVCHRYELACEFLAAQYNRPVGPDHIVTCKDVQQIVCSPFGYKKNVGSRTFRIVTFRDKKIEFEYRKDL